MSYPRGATWRDYSVTLTYPNGQTYPASVRAISRRDAEYRATKRWGRQTRSPIRWVIGDLS